MRKILFLAVALCGLVGFQACSLDNYDKPSASLTGALVDSETNENMPCQYQNGSRIRIYEFYNGQWSNQPNDFYTKQDGTFTNNAIFPGKYQIVAEGPFETLDKVEVEISGATALELKVIPFLRISANATATGTSVKMTANIAQSAGKHAIKAVEFYCGKTPYVDKNTNDKKVEIDLSGMTDEQIIASTLQAEFTELKSGSTLYFRVGALGNNPGNYYNYSKVIEVTIP